MKIRSGMVKFTIYLTTALLLLYQALGELIPCCRAPFRLRELISSFREGSIYMLLILSGSLLILSAFLAVKNNRRADLIALAASLVGFGFYIIGFWLVPIGLLLMFARLNAMIFILGGLFLLITFMLSIMNVSDASRKSERREAS